MYQWYQEGYFHEGLEISFGKGKYFSLNDFKKIAEGGSPTMPEEPAENAQ